MLIAKGTGVLRPEGTRSVLAHLKSLGYDAADYQIPAQQPGTGIYAMPEKEFAAFMRCEAEAAKVVGLPICQVHGPWPYDDRILEQREPKFQATVRALHAAAIMGAPYLVIHPVMPVGWAESAHHEEDKAENIAFVRRLLPYAKDYGVKIAVENMPHPHVPCGHVSELVECIDTIDSEYVVACLDTGHCTCIGDDAGEMARLLDNRLACMHVHDNDGKQDFHYLPYFGVANWDSFIEGLRAIRYRGIISLETNVPEHLPGSLQKEAEEWLARLAQSIADAVMQES